MWNRKSSPLCNFEPRLHVPVIVVSLANAAWSLLLSVLIKHCRSICPTSGRPWVNRRRRFMMKMMMYNSKNNG